MLLVHKGEESGERLHGGRLDAKTECVPLGGGLPVAVQRDTACVNAAARRDGVCLTVVGRQQDGRVQDGAAGRGVRCGRAAASQADPRRCGGSRAAGLTAAERQQGGHGRQQD